jgi:hypothetical protein
MGHFAPAFKKCALSLAMQLVLDVVFNTALALSALCEVLPGSQNHPELVVVARLIVELVKTSLLGTFFFLQLPNTGFLLRDGLHHLRNLVVSAAGVLIKIFLKFLHVPLPHLHVGIHQSLLEVLLNPVVHQRK